MSVSQVLPDIYQLTLPTPFPVGDVHTYLILDHPVTLVDTGVHSVPSRKALQEAMTWVGLTARDIEQIVLTHSHLDHVGQAAWLRAASGAIVVSHPRAIGKVSNMAAYAQGAKNWATDLLQQAGVPISYHGPVAAFYEVIPRFTQDVTVDRGVEEGDCLVAGQRHWRILFCPGHSGDLICLYDPSDQLLIGSDHLLAHISSNALLEPPGPGEGERRQPLIEYWQSLQRLEEMAIGRLLPGHGEVITDHVALIQRRRARREQRLGRIETFLAKRPGNVWQITQHLFPELAENDVFLALSEVIGHLDMLLDQGRVQRLANRRPALFLS